MIPLYELADDADDPDERKNEMAKARSAVRALERRGLVHTIRMADPYHLVDTTTIMSEVRADWSIAYVAEPNTRAWYGTFVGVRPKPTKLDLDWETLPLKVMIEE
jgi:hypothetical protein